MGLSLFKIKKWTKMILGKSVYHVNQNEGKCYSRDEIKGYYNDLTEKVLRFGRDDDEVPETVVDTGETIFFPIAIFQYGLGAYDLYLINGDLSMLHKAISCADWAVKNQQNDGGWNTFFYENIEHPYSSMAQGEGISLLARVYIVTKNQKYKQAIEKAKDFMLKPIEEGGTTRYVDNDVYFYECTHDPLILNGWIFSIWGIMDYFKLTGDNETEVILDKTIATLEKRLPDFDLKYWSKYEDGKRICSPFYQKLHIAQLLVMFALTEKQVFIEYANRWGDNQNSFWNKKRAFIKKAIQKVLE